MVKIKQEKIYTVYFYLFYSFIFVKIIVCV